MIPNFPLRLRLGQWFSRQVIGRPRLVVLRAGMWACLVATPVRAQDSAPPEAEGTAATPAAQPARDAGSGQPSAEACVDAHEKAVDLADTQHLLEARDAFAICVAPTCPRVIREECASELSRLRTRIPSVVFAVKNEDGKDVTDVTVSVAGRHLLRGLTSRALPLNPGRYEFQLTAADGPTATEAVLLREGEQQRRVEVQFQGVKAIPVAAPLPATSVAPQSPWTPPVVVSAVVGALGVASFGYFAVAGTAVEGCSPNCSAEEVTALRRDYAIADVSLLVGIAGFTAAVLLYDAPDEEGASASLSARHDGGVQLDGVWRF